MTHVRTCVDFLLVFLSARVRTYRPSVQVSPVAAEPYSAGGVRG